MRTAIYLRISQDRAGERAGVERQEADCRDLAERHGWEITEVYSDNDISAVDGRTRTGFEALLRARPDRIVVWHTDRLLRRMDDLERVIALGVNVHAVQAGDLDLSTPAGRAVARTITAWAAYEGEQKGARQRAANRQRAQQGVSVWSRRPYGFDRGEEGVYVVEHEAEVIRQAATSVLGGSSLTLVVRHLNEEGVPNSLGRPWSVTTLRRVLINHRLKGRVTYLGQDYGQHHPSILADDVFDRLEAVLTAPGRRTATSTRTRHLLSGLALCGRCGARMFSTTNTSGTTRRKVASLRCSTCYLTRQMDLTEAFVKDVIAARLAREDLADLLAAPEDVAALRAEVSVLRERADGLVVLLAEGLATPASVHEQARRLKDRQDALERRLDAALGDSPLKALSDAPDPATAFLEASLEQQRAVVSALIKVTILPVGKGQRWSPEGLRIEAA